MASRWDDPEQRALQSRLMKNRAKTKDGRRHMQRMSKISNAKPTNKLMHKKMISELNADRGFKKETNGRSKQILYDFEFEKSNSMRFMWPLQNKYWNIYNRK